MPSLGTILAAVRGGPAIELFGSAAVEIVDVTLDSREVRPGWLFCCVRGDKVDGHDFAAAAVAAGAVALLVDHVLDDQIPRDVAQLVVDDTRAAVGWLAAAAHGHPSDDVLTVGVTGTNGKTTTTQLIGDVVRSTGVRVEVFGTLTGRHTTPEAPDLQRRLAHCRDRGVAMVVMEVSSHALALDRVCGARFALAVFTNLGRDHLDLHGTMERYFDAKALLFQPQLTDRGLVNLDDAYASRLADSAAVSTSGYSLAQLTDVVIEPTRHRYTWRGANVEVAMGGAFNVSNSLAAAEACRLLGIAVADIARGLGAALPVPGRFEPIDEGQGFAVIVDYAHTPDGLREALGAARAAVGDGRVIVVFGAGGDRDREKRPEMGRVATAADLIVITSDNPRSEAPSAIIDAIASGVPSDYRGLVVIDPDRRSAMARAFSAAEAGDIVVVAGKGHEGTQTIGSEVFPFDDRTVARQLLRGAT